MGRADEIRARYEAELAVAELEDELIACKESGTPDELHAAKMRLRDARREFRLQREGSAAVSPATIATATTANDAGGVA